ncbi:helix-turn-helix domain-containing protein [Burkholderia sp. SCN-KJ]|uniref:helix-turn-helix domain-containing protein n=1 Tax=Burkholderia sp. SCN-KJ TaxID=2969248 RepID=UPI0021506A6D|nr:helix-turn-helix domain-containing protein [Burkholderia sp. SCN-KJ]MCR4466720.1 helix-turn-helix domain-containing protein [Burkholderia sp. SCN-KJ]
MKTAPESLARPVDLDRLRARFAAGEPLPETALPASVARSWLRSRDAGLRPWQTARYEMQREFDEPRADRRLLRCVAQEIEQLWAAFGGSEWTIFCVNPRGTIIHARRSPQCDDTLLTPIVAGRRIVEPNIGTTAPSCVIHDGTEAVVAGAQHYLDEFSRVFCLAVPLVGFDGEVIGALDITGIGRRNVMQLREQFRHAALSAEQRLYAMLRDCHLLQVQYDPRWLGTPLAGVVALDEAGRVRAVSRLARQMLDLAPEGPVAPVDLRQLFPGATPAQQRRLLTPARTPQRIARDDGSHVWVRTVRAPLDRGTMARDADVLEEAADVCNAAPAASPQASLHEQSLDAIRRALGEHDGNVSAAARQLGISRTTLYAKLRRLDAAGLRTGGPHRVDQNEVAPVCEVKMSLRRSSLTKKCGTLGNS